MTSVFPPLRRPDDPAYATDCELALAEAFFEIVEAAPARFWIGDEAEFWPVRREAVREGWDPLAVDRALSSLAVGRIMTGSRQLPG